MGCSRVPSGGFPEEDAWIRSCENLLESQALSFRFFWSSGPDGWGLVWDPLLPHTAESRGLASLRPPVITGPDSGTTKGREHGCR